MWIMNSHLSKVTCPLFSSGMLQLSMSLSQHRQISYTRAPENQGTPAKLAEFCVAEVRALRHELDLSFPIFSDRFYFLHILIFGSRTVVSYDMSNSSSVETLTFMSQTCSIFSCMLWPEFGSRVDDDQTHSTCEIRFSHPSDCQPLTSRVAI